MRVLNAQGTKFYLVPTPATPWATCSEAITSLRAGKNIYCPQSVGDLSEQRNSTEYKCLSSDETVKSLGAISRSSFDIAVLFNPDDKAGLQLLQQSFRTNKPIIMGIEYGDTMIYFSINVSGFVTGISMDSAITNTATIEISSNIMECSTAALTTAPIVNNGIIIQNNGIPVVNTH